MIVCPAQPTAPDMAGVIQVKQFLDRFEELRGRPVPMVRDRDGGTDCGRHRHAHADHGGRKRPPRPRPDRPSLKTETKRIWSRVKKDEKRAQLGEVQRTSIAMPSRF